MPLCGASPATQLKATSRPTTLVWFKSPRAGEGGEIRGRSG